MRNRKIVIISLCLCLFLASGVVFAQKTVVVTNLYATVRSGQVFLKWNEASVPEGVTFNVYKASRPLNAKTLSKATLIGHHIEAGSACDWWQNPASFDSGAEQDRSFGFLIDDKELDPQSGLFVHTVNNNEPMYFAVLASSEDASSIVSGVNSLKSAVVAKPELPQAIQLQDGLQGNEPGAADTIMYYADNLIRFKKFKLDI